MKILCKSVPSQVATNQKVKQIFPILKFIIRTTFDSYKNKIVNKKCSKF